MTKLRRLSLLDLPTAAQVGLVAGARDTTPVRGLTHGFYKYPARFSPSFVRAAIETFTQPADLVLDNHVGGGTTLVEALALGRHAVGVDISALAEFVATVKTTIYSEPELDWLAAWAKGLANVVHMHKSSIRSATYAKLGYYKHLNHPARWRLRKAIEQGIASATRLGSRKLSSFGRCVVLRTAQWALDGRKTLPSMPEFRDMLFDNAGEMIEGARQLSMAVRQHREVPVSHVINRSAAGLTC